MTIPVFRWLLPSVLLLSSSLAGAQPATDDGTAVPESAGQAAFQLQYFSVFTHYQYFRDQPLLSWQETNDNVGKIGGWRFYARDAKHPETDASTDGAKPAHEKKQPSGAIERSDQLLEHGRKP